MKLISRFLSKIVLSVALVGQYLAKPCRYFWFKVWSLEFHYLALSNCINTEHRSEV